MEVDDHSSRQPFDVVVVGGGQRHIDVRSAPRDREYCNYYSRRAPGNDDQAEPEPEAPRRVFFTERGAGTMDDDGAHRPRTAASSAAIFDLKEVRAGDASASQSECAVCLRDFDDAEETLTAMPCSHAFHQLCIFHWLNRNGVCPLCRHQLPTEEEEEEEESVYPPLTIVVRDD